MSTQVVNGAPPRIGLVSHFEEIVASLALVVVIASTFWGVITRYITSQPATWSSEIASIAFAWLVFMGAAAGFKYGMHVSVDMLTKLLPAAVQKVIAILCDVLVLVFLITLFVLAVQFSIEAWEDPTSVLRLPRTVTYAAVVLGSFCMFFRYAKTALRRLQGKASAWMDMVGEAGAEL